MQDPFLHNGPEILDTDSQAGMTRDVKKPVNDGLFHECHHKWRNTQIRRLRASNLR